METMDDYIEFVGEQLVDIPILKRIPPLLQLKKKKAGA